MSETAQLWGATDPDDLICQVLADHQPVARWCLVSGGHDSTVVAWRCQEHYTGLAFIDTGTAVPGVRDFVHEFALWLGKPLTVLETPADVYRRIVLGGVNPKTGTVKRPLGFPGPAQHTRCYVELKERQIERLVRESKDGHDRRARVLAITGIRRAESQRRRRREPITRRGSLVFANPLIDWTNADMRAARIENSIPESDVSALLHRSGECNCGAFAAPGEREELQQLWPEWFDRAISSLEREAVNRALPCARWGTRCDLRSQHEGVIGDPGELCGDCQLRLDGLAALHRRA